MTPVELQTLYETMDHAYNNIIHAQQLIDNNLTHMHMEGAGLGAEHKILSKMLDHVIDNGFDFIIGLEMQVKGEDE